MSISKNAALIPLSGNKEQVVTGDGSITFFNTTYKESYHARSVGAYTESMHTFIDASSILRRLAFGNVRLLDICFGLGYNLAVTLEEIEKHKPGGRLEIVSLELDMELIEIVKRTCYFWPVAGYKRLRKLLYNQIDRDTLLRVVKGDASKTLGELEGQFDVIYFDPFSKRKNPEMWTPAIFKELFRLLKKDGIATTYSSAKGVRRDMVSAGFKINEIERFKSSKQPGTRFFKGS